MPAQASSLFEGLNVRLGSDHNRGGGLVIKRVREMGAYGAGSS
jgi:hypothetical protein